ncbi:MAG: response regulator [Anaerolineales bacterium]|nr:response regulator [Anaerolineales bacterium]
MARSKLARSDPVLIPKQARKYFKMNRRVLVVEADKTLRQMLATILDDNGFEVTTANDNIVALERLQQQAVDFILLDMLIPSADNVEIWARLRANPATKDVPVMVIIADPTEKNIEQVSHLGVHHFLPKPFTEDELLLKILTLLTESSM